MTGQVTGRLACWIGSAWFAALAVFGFWQYSARVSVTSPNQAFLAVMSLAAAAVLLFPPLWRQMAGWGYFRLFTAIILAGIGLSMPIETHAVKLDLPALAVAKAP